MSDNPALQRRISQEDLDEIATLHEDFIVGKMGGRRAVMRDAELRGLSLAGRDMRQADFSGCRMENMDLSATNFREASLYACILNGSNLHEACFIRADLRGAQIESADLENADLEAADLRGGALTHGNEIAPAMHVNFKGANLSGARLVGSLAGSADFSDAIMAKADLTGADLRGAVFEGADMSEVEINGAQLIGANMKSAILTGVPMDDIRRSGVDTEYSITDETAGKSVEALHEPLDELINHHKKWVKTAGADGHQLDLSGYDLRVLLELKAAKLTAIKAEDARWNGMDLSDLEAQSAKMDRSDFRRCILSAADFRASSLAEVLFSHAEMKGADFGPLYLGKGDNRKQLVTNLRGANMRYVDVSGGKFQYANLKDADLSYADFSGCDLTGANLKGAKLKGAVFTNAIINDALFDSRPNTGG